MGKKKGGPDAMRSAPRGGSKETLKPENGRSRNLGLAAIVLAVGAAITTLYVRNQSGDSVDAVLTQSAEARPERRETIGPFEFIFDAAFSDEEFIRIRDLFQSSYPKLSEYIPGRKDVGKQIRVVRADGRVSRTVWHEGTITIAPQNSDRVVIHELGHLNHGDRDTSVDFIEEGLAVGMAELVARDLNLHNDNDLVSHKMNNTLRDGGMSILSDVKFDESYFPLHPMRLEFAGRIFTDFEKIHPGFIRKFHEAYYNFLEKGGDKHDAKAFFDMMKSIAGDEVFDQITSENPLMRFNDELKNKELLYLSFLELRGGHKAVQACLVHKNEKGEEMPLPHIEFNYQIVNKQNGKISQKFFGRSDKLGVVDIVLAGPNVNSDLVKQFGIEGKGDYKLIMNIGSKQEEFEFSI